jgi:hypothetical protein
MTNKAMVIRAPSLSLAKMSEQVWFNGEPVLAYDAAFFTPAPLPTDNQHLVPDPTPAPVVAPIVSDESPTEAPSVAWRLKNQIRQIEFLIATLEKSNSQAENLISKYQKLLHGSDTQLKDAVDTVNNDWKVLAEVLTNYKLGE